MKYLVLLFMTTSSFGMRFDKYLATFQRGPAIKNEKLYNLGKSLFADKILSGNKNISCMSCHQASLGTGDSLPLSLGEGANHKTLQQESGARLNRNAPSLFNLGIGEFQMYFWDGRVNFSFVGKNQFTTPYTPINFYDPKRANPYEVEAKYIVDELQTGLGAQVLFPLINHEEMLGQWWENLLELDSTETIWQKITNRVVNKRSYQDLLQGAYPTVTKYNIGHIANAIAHFITHAFRATDTLFDKHIRGEKKLEQQSFDGLQAFMKHCIQCHRFPILTNHSFQNIGIPSIGNELDEGVENLPVKFQFKVPPLRNVALTAPYMHNGSFQTLEEVVKHYADPEKSLREYDISSLQIKFQKHYKYPIKHLDTDETIEYKIDNLSSFLPRLEITQQEQEDIVHFLRYGLTDETFLERVKDLEVNL